VVLSCGDSSSTADGDESSSTGGGEEADTTVTITGATVNPTTTVEPDSSGTVDTTDTTTDTTSTTGTDTTSSTTDGGCVADGDCDDDNPCTSDVCNAGECSSAPIDGVPAPMAEQVAGDCHTIQCAAGVGTDEVDDADLPDDSNDCTENVCMRGVPSNPAIAAGTACNNDMGVCNDAGTCVECITADDCDALPEDDDCQTRTCTDGVCGQDFDPQGTVVNESLQTVGDCEVVVCNGAGGTEQDVDDDDLPNDSNDCTTDTCTLGDPVFTPVTAGTACTGGVCNDAAACVGCLMASDCGADTFCQTRTCVDNTCGVDNEPAGTVLPEADQTANNCQEMQCDGNGVAAPVPDDDDLPLDDGNDCTGQACNMGTPSFPFVPINTACDDNGGAFCSAVGTCVECNVTGQCPLPGSCLVAVCNMNDCGAVPAMMGTSCNDGVFCNGLDSCGPNANCVGGNTDPCEPQQGDGDCNSGCTETGCNAPETGTPCEDNNVCTIGLMCGNGLCGTPETQGIDCGDCLECDGAGVCETQCTMDQVCDMDMCTTP